MIRSNHCNSHTILLSCVYSVFLYPCVPYILTLRKHILNIVHINGRSLLLNLHMHTYTDSVNHAKLTAHRRMVEFWWTSLVVNQRQLLWLRQPVAGLLLQPGDCPVGCRVLSLVTTGWRVIWSGGTCIHRVLCMLTICWQWVRSGGDCILSHPTSLPRWSTLCRWRWR